MKHSSFPYEQLQLPEYDPEDESMREAPQESGLSEEVDRELDRQDSKAESFIIARVRAARGGIPTSHEVELTDESGSSAVPRVGARRQRRKTYKNGRPEIRGKRTTAALRHADQRPDLKPFPWGTRED